MESSKNDATSIHTRVHMLKAGRRVNRTDRDIIRLRPTNVLEANALQFKSRSCSVDLYPVHKLLISA